MAENNIIKHETGFKLNDMNKAQDSAYMTEIHLVVCKEKYSFTGHLIVCRTLK